MAAAVPLPADVFFSVASFEDFLTEPESERKSRLRRATEKTNTADFRMERCGDNLLLSEHGRFLQPFVGMILAEQAVEAAAVEKNSQIITPFLGSLAEPGRATICREGIQIDVEEGSVPGGDELDPAGLVFPQAAVTPFIQARLAFVGADSAPCSGGIPWRSFRKIELFPGSFVNTKRNLVPGKRAEAVRAHANGSGGWFHLAG
jgi:hypothetical protein